MLIDLSGASELAPLIRDSLCLSFSATCKAVSPKKDHRPRPEGYCCLLAVSLFQNPVELFENPVEQQLQKSLFV